MKKAKFVKNHIISITIEMHKELLEITGREEVSMAAWVRDAIQRKFDLISEQEWEHKILTDQVPEEEFEVHAEDMTLEEEKRVEEEEENAKRGL